MTEQERQMLNNLLNNLAATPSTQKDPQADDMIRRALSRKPDATYLLVQRTLLQDIALQNAQSRIEALEQQLRQAQPISDSRASSSGSFLGGGGGWNQSYQQSQPQQNWSVPPTAPSTAQPNAFSGFLKSAATTAAGVAGGALLFQGLENLFDRGTGGQNQPQEIIENNYIEQPGYGNDYGDVSQDNYIPNDYQDDQYNDPGLYNDDNSFL